MHALLGLASEREILSHPKVGASWEGFAFEETLRAVRPEAAYFWATHTGAEMDLLLFSRGRRYGVEVEFQDAPRLTPSMRIALEDLDLTRLTVLYPDDRRYPPERRVDVVPLAEPATRGADVLIAGPGQPTRPKQWWRELGRKHYPRATSLLITADSGGSNGSRLRLWKWELPKLAQQTGLVISVCHLPPGTSKWNKIEHRLFSHIAMNWRGKPPW